MKNVSWPRAARLLVSACLLFAVAPGCAPSGALNAAGGTVTGKVYVTGNEPFTKLALQMEDGTACVLLCSKDLDAQLSKLQGKPVKIHYSEVQAVPEGKAVRVVSMELLPQ